ncbi:MAG: toll/interleukin-1 receptor domain-containing protein, partial [Pirellula sp.]
MSSQENKRESPPTAFISYSHDNEEHKRWVRQLAAHLRLNGIDAKLDYWEAPLGADFGRFM